MATFFDKGRHRRGGQGATRASRCNSRRKECEGKLLSAICHGGAYEGKWRTSGLCHIARRDNGRSRNSQFRSGGRDCLATPNGPPPPDSQWLYRTDHLKQRKCWHLVARGGVGRARVIVTQPAVLGSTLDPDRPTNRQLEPLLTASPALRGSSAEGSIQQGRVGHQAGADTPTWPDPPSPAAAENIAWPAPPSPTHAGDVCVAGPGNAYS